MRSWLHHPPPRLGRRGAILVTFGVIWVLIGATALANGDVEDPVLLYQHLPSWLRFALWVGTAAVAFSVCLTPPARTDGLGFAALIIMPIERAFAHLWAWAVSLIPGGSPGLADAWQSALLWVLVINVLVICSGWRENTPVREQGPDRE